MDNRQDPHAERRVEGSPAQHSNDRMSLYAARSASPEVIRARELRQRAEQYAARNMVPFGRRPAKRAVRPRRTVVASIAALTALVGGGGAALAGQTVYQIQYGDTLSELADTHGSSVEDIARINQIPDPDVIITGDTLLIPSDATPVTSTGDGGSAVHVVAWGDTLSEIATTYGTSVERLMAFNALSDPDTIIVGDELLVPTTVEGGGEEVIVGSEDSGDATDDDVDPGDMSDDADDEHGAVDDPEGDGDATDTAAADEGGTGDEVDADAGDAGSATDDGTSDPGDGTTTDDTATTQDDGDTGEQQPPDIQVAALHLVTDGETPESIAGMYGISVEELVAANPQAAGGTYAGMILAIPVAGNTATTPADDVEDVSADPADSAAAAALSAATEYWGGAIPEDETLAALESGEYTIDVFSSLLERYGYHAGIFDSSVGVETLTAQLDNGIPVIIWVDDANGYRAVVVESYDESTAMVIDPASGTSVVVPWDELITAWENAGGEAIAVAPL